MKIERMPVIYLASPYTSKNANLQIKRAMQMEHIVADILFGQQWIYPISPIVNSWRVANVLLEDESKIDWYQYGLNILARCDGMLVVRQEGWATSKGIAIENEYAVNNEIPIVHSNPCSVIEGCKELYDMLVNGGQHAH